MYKRAFFVAVGLLLTAACADPTGPTVDVPSDQFAAVIQAAGENGGDVRSHILRHATSAPRLESYRLSFWAVRGEESYVEIRYLGGSDRSSLGDAPVAEEIENGGIDGTTFLWLLIPKNALEYHPDGSEIGWGERVLITISVHPERLYVSLQPSGLTFNPQHLPWLYLSYDGADPDYDRDGNVDVVDRYIEHNFLSLWSFTPSKSLSRFSFMPSNRWMAAGSGPKPKDKKKKNLFPTKIVQFSDVAVSW